MGSPYEGSPPLGPARDGPRPLEAMPPAASNLVARSAARMKRANDKPRGTHVVRAFSASPHDEISPERHRVGGSKRPRTTTPSFYRLSANCQPKCPHPISS